MNLEFKYREVPHEDGENISICTFARYDKQPMPISVGKATFSHKLYELLEPEDRESIFTQLAMIAMNRLGE